MKKGTHKPGAERENSKSVYNKRTKQTDRKYRVDAEERMGRPLKKGESVHHKDGNPKNNSPKNCVVTKAKPGSKAHKVKGKK